MQINAQSRPLEVFAQWLAQAKAHPAIKEATAMTLSTLSAQHELESRVVLCKSFDEQGFVFFTNYDSRKGLALHANPHAALLFFWDPLFRQVKLQGSATQVSRAESEAYWRTRPRDSQLSQWISKQSQTVSSREQLEQEWQQAERQWQNQDIPCPANWGGYVLRPKKIEFWVGQPGRLHDRYQFEKSPSGWTFCRLYP